MFNMLTGHKNEVFLKKISLENFVSGVILGVILVLQNWLFFDSFKTRFGRNFGVWVSGAPQNFFPNPATPKVSPKIFLGS